MEKMKCFRVEVIQVMLCVWLLIIMPSLACSSSKTNSTCRDCILDQMKYVCPGCVPILRCMAKCLWGNLSQSKCTKNLQSKCIKKCDCNGGTPRLSDCKKCMSRCKCSCSK
ncbi:hypothetical protein AQUCO_02800144v1 [Aquilegia coerulea]|uniref:TNFR-Cys domain-containing protein n=1 Tax=Aquilegia coerulea TaxID=218851 RepID=A0A2G5D438_AQUCA|nr:hypothetical protein AQUCO_02800144v1 [Aquilegia coerulea]